MSTPLENVITERTVPNGVILYESAKAKYQSTHSTLRELDRIYRQWAQELNELARRYEGSPYFMQSLYYAELERELALKINALAEEESNLIIAALFFTTAAITAEALRFNALFGGNTLSSTALSSLLSQIPNRIANGQLYQNWTLANALQADTADTRRSITQVLAGLRAQGISPSEAARQLARYVNPQYSTPLFRGTNGNRIYPKALHANPARLANTLIQHTYQQAIHEWFIQNNQIIGYIWQAAGTHPCGLCQGLSGMYFPKENLILDHPNGQCTMQPVLRNSVEHFIIKQWNERQA